MSLQYVVQGAGIVRWTCDLCGEHKVDSGPELASLIQARHICKENPSMPGKMVVLICWEILDGVMDELMPLAKQEKEATIALGDERRLFELKAKARGMAEILCVWTVPHYRTANDVAKEAARRYKARAEGNTEYVTLGTVVALASADLAISLGTKATPRKPTPVATKITVKPFEQTAIKLGASSGMFTEAELAGMYKISIDEVRAVIAG